MDINEFFADETPRQPNPRRKKRNYRKEQLRTYAILAAVSALIILFILPPPFIIPVVANEPAERTEISATLSAMTLLTMVLFAIVSILMKV